jgi:hypothetical protein
MRPGRHSYQNCYHVVIAVGDVHGPVARNLDDRLIRALRAARMRARTPRSDLDRTDLIRWGRDHNYDYHPDDV